MKRAKRELIFTVIANVVCILAFILVRTFHKGKYASIICFIILILEVAAFIFFIIKIGLMIYDYKIENRINDYNFDYYNELNKYLAIGKNKNRSFLNYEKWKEHIINSGISMEENQYSNFYHFLRRKLRYKEEEADLYGKLIIPVSVAFLPLLLSEHVKENSIAGLVVILVVLLLPVIMLTKEIHSINDEKNFISDILEILEEIIRNKEMDKSIDN